MTVVPILIFFVAAAAPVRPRPRPARSRADAVRRRRSRATSSAQTGRGSVRPADAGVRRPRAAAGDGWPAPRRGARGRDHAVPVLNVDSPEQVRALTAAIQAAAAAGAHAADGPPPDRRRPGRRPAAARSGDGCDAVRREHGARRGRATPDLAERVGRAIGLELRALGRQRRLRPVRATSRRTRATRRSGSARSATIRRRSRASPRPSLRGLRSAGVAGDRQALPGPGRRRRRTRTMGLPRPRPRRASGSRATELRAVPGRDRGRRGPRDVGPRRGCRALTGDPAAAGDAVASASCTTCCGTSSGFEGLVDHRRAGHGGAAAGREPGRSTRRRDPTPGVDLLLLARRRGRPAPDRGGADARRPQIGLLDAGALRRSADRLAPSPALRLAGARAAGARTSSARRSTAPSRGSWPNARSRSSGTMPGCCRCGSSRDARIARGHAAAAGPDAGGHVLVRSRRPWPPRCARRTRGRRVRHRRTRRPTRRDRRRCARRPRATTSIVVGTIAAALASRAGDARRGAARSRAAGRDGRAADAVRPGRLPGGPDARLHATRSCRQSLDALAAALFGRDRRIPRPAAGAPHPGHAAGSRRDQERRR